MNGKEIVIVTISLGNDGAERVLAELANEWADEGNKVTIIQTNAGNYGCNYSISDSIEIVNFQLKYKNKIQRYIYQIKALIKELNKRPNAIALSFIVSSTFILAMCKPFIKNKIVVSERNDPRKCPEGKLQRKLRDLSFSMADVCVFQTKQAKEIFSRNVQKKGYIISNPINGDLPPRHEGERRKAIVTACRLHPQKNLPLLIRAFQMLNKDFPEYVLEIYGQGDERENLESLIKDLNLDEKVFLMGFSDNVFYKMVDASMYVSSSDYEGISNSMLEALGMGVPTVATDCPVGGAGEMITDNVNGILVPVGNVKSMYEAMYKILSDKDFSNKLSINAYKIREKFSIHQVANDWLTIM